MVYKDMLHTTCLCVTVQQAAGRVLSREDEAREGSDGQDRGVRGTQVTSHHKHSYHLISHHTPLYQMSLQLNIAFHCCTTNVHTIYSCTTKSYHRPCWLTDISTIQYNYVFLFTYLDCRPNTINNGIYLAYVNN